jgi:hypothetical protein
VRARPSQASLYLATVFLASCGTVKMPQMPQGTPVTVETTPVGEKPLVDKPATVATAPATIAPAAPAKPAAPANVPPPTAAVEKRANEHLDRMRAIKPAKDAKQAEQYNRELQEAWKYFVDNPSSVHVLRRALSRELALQRGRSDFMLLDLGFFLHERGQPADRDLARNALFTLDPAAEIVKFNQQELFQFTQSVAIGRDPRVLAFIDRAFLRPGIAVRIPEGNVTLDASGTSAFLYGAYGPDSEAHLVAMLKTPIKDKPLARRVLEVLTWMGTSASNQLVKNVLLDAMHDKDTFMRTATFFMAIGGPQGRSIMMAVQPAALDVWTASYFEQIQPRVARTSFSSLRPDLAANAASKAVLDSDKPRDELIAQLYAERLKVFRAPPNREALREIQRINALVNALRYRDS